MEQLSDTVRFNAERLNDDAEARRITEAQLQGLQARVGASILGEALMSMRSGPGVITRPAPYLDKVCAALYVRWWNQQVRDNVIDPRVPRTIARKWT